MFGLVIARSKATKQSNQLACRFIRQVVILYFKIATAPSGLRNDNNSVFNRAY